MTDDTNNSFEQVSLSDKITQTLSRYRGVFFSLILILLISIICFVGFFVYLDNSTKQLADEFYEIEKRYESDKVSKNDKSLEKLKVDFETFASKHKNTYYSQKSYLMLASLESDKDKKIDLYKKALSEKPNSFLKSTISLSIANLYFEKDDFEQSLNIVNSIENKSLPNQKKDINQERIWFLKGRIFEKLSKKDEAIKEYENIVSNYSNNFSSLAKDRIIYLKVK